jgi:gluconokinase
MARTKILCMPRVPGLRSLYAKVGRLVFFGRMLDKIRLHAIGKLPPEYQTNLGDAQPKLNDGRCCRFLGIEYQALVARTLEGGRDEEILAWAHAHGTPRTDEECDIWNRFMTKGGWRDDRSARLQQLVAEYGLVGRPIETVFDLFDYDEGRDPATGKPWLHL